MATKRVVTPNATEWLSVANPAVADTGAGVYLFNAGVTAAIVKIIKVPLASTFSLATLGIKHAGAADWNYIIAVWESDDLPAAGDTRTQMVAKSCGLVVPSMTISKDAVEMGLPMPEFRTKRKYVFVEIVSTTTNPGGNITFSPLFYYAEDERS